MCRGGRIKVPLFSSLETASASERQREITVDTSRVVQRGSKRDEDEEAKKFLDEMADATGPPDVKQMSPPPPPSLSSSSSASASSSHLFTSSSSSLSFAS